MLRKRPNPFITALITFPFSFGLTGATPTTTPSTTPTPTILTSPSPVIHESSCDYLTASTGTNLTVPATVTFKTRGTDTNGVIQSYRYYFGDGTSEESINSEMAHRYEVSGTFYAKAEIKDATGTWKTSSMCETTVTIQSSAVESAKSDCSDLFITEGNNKVPPSTARFMVSGFDNKGPIQKYKIDFGDGTADERTDRRFEKLYPKAGTYTVRGYVMDSKNNWKGGSGTCAKSLYINTTPLTKQPSTGTPTGFTFVALASGLWAFLFFAGKKFSKPVS